MIARAVIDVSVAVKWVVEENGTAEALTLRRQTRLLAPDLLIAECANVLWKKVRRGELTPRLALAAGRLLEAAEVELLPARALLASALRLALQVGHPAYDCLYLALALDQNCRFVTADRSFIARLNAFPRFRGRAVELTASALGPNPPNP